MIIDFRNKKDSDTILEFGFGNGKFFDDLLSFANIIRIYGVELPEEIIPESICVVAQKLIREKSDVEIM